MGYFYPLVSVHIIFRKKSASNERKQDDIRLMELCLVVFVSWYLLILRSTWLLFMTALSRVSGRDRSELVLSSQAASGY